MHGTRSVKRPENWDVKRQGASQRIVISIVPRFVQVATEWQASENHLRNDG